jgi:thioredoxin-related protein
VLTVIDDEAPDDLTPVLEKSGTVVTEHGPGGLMATFSVTGTPTFLLYDRNGTLLGSGNALEEALERWIP